MKTTLVKIVFSAALILLLALLLNCRDDKNPVAPSGFNFDPNQIPRFVRANYIDPTRMKRISKFRSAIGSDYSDDFEKCRNMKNAFEPRSDCDWSALDIFSPLVGKIKEIIPGASGSQISIQSQEFPEFSVHLFNVRLSDSMAVGQPLTAGEKIGTHFAAGVLSEIAVSVNTTKGWKLISYFDVMTDSVLSTFAACQAYSRLTFIISKEERDSDPLICNNGAFAGEGTLENWHSLNCHYDVDAWGCPRFVDVNYVEFDRIWKISKFRSAAGHDYSDDFEDCRSMKHYFWPDDQQDWATIRLYIPVDGVVSWRFEEFMGTQVWIRSDEYPDFQFGIFHIRLQDSTLTEGRVVKAGELLGTHFAYLNPNWSKTFSDIAVSVDTNHGRKLISYFDVMTDDLFQRYQARGLANRSDVIISKSERDTAPLTCSGESFIAGTGVLEDWVTLE